MSKVVFKWNPSGYKSVKARASVQSIMRSAGENAAAIAEARLPKNGIRRAPHYKVSSVQLPHGDTGVRVAPVSPVAKNYEKKHHALRAAARRYKC